MSSGVTHEAWSTELALGPRGVVDATEAVASFGVAELDGTLGVHVATAVTADTASGGPVVASTALITPGSTVVGKALVAHWGATGICTDRADRLW